MKLLRDFIDHLILDECSKHEHNILSLSKKINLSYRATYRRIKRLEKSNKIVIKQSKHDKGKPILISTKKQTMLPKKRLQVSLTKIDIEKLTKLKRRFKLKSNSNCISYIINRIYGRRSHE